MGPTEQRRAGVVQQLRQAGCVFAEDEADILLAEAPGDLDAMIQRRVAGEPLEHIVGWADFCGVRIAVDPGLFVPRQRTALVVEQAVDLIRRHAMLGEGASMVVDLCCGTGAIAAVLATQVDSLELHAADLDPAAVQCARRNLAAFPGATVYQGDLLGALPAQLRGRVTVLTANTPYVPSHAIGSMPSEARDHEALLALDGGSDGLDVQRRLAAEVADWLAPEGHVLVETSQAQAPMAVAVFNEAGLAARVVHDDERGGTVVVSTKSSPAGRAL